MQYFTLLLKAIVRFPVWAFYKAFPKAAMKAAISVERDKLRKAAELVGQQQGEINRLEREIKEDSPRVSQLEKAIEKAFAANDEIKAKGIIASITSLKSSLDKKTKLLETLRKQADKNINLIKSNAGLIKEAESKAKQMEADLAMANVRKSQAEMQASLSNNLAIGGTYSEVFNEVASQIDRANGAADLAETLSEDTNSDVFEDISQDEEFLKYKSKYVTPETETILEQCIVQHTKENS